MVAMEPIKSATEENITQLYQSCVEMLTAVGFTVVSLSVDNHRSNQSFIKKLGEEDLPKVLPGGIHVFFDSVSIRGSSSRNSFVIYLNLSSILYVFFYKVNLNIFIVLGSYW